MVQIAFARYNPALIFVTQLQVPRMSEKVHQQSRLKALIAKGKEQGYLTYAEVNDHLPKISLNPTKLKTSSR